MKEKKYFSSLMMLAATLLWGLSYSVQSVIADSSLGTFTIVFLKGIGSLALLPVIFVKKIRLEKEAVRGGIIIGAAVFLGCFFQQKGIESSTVSKASFITSLYIIFVPLFSLILGRSVTKKIWISVVIALAGLYFLCMHSDSGIVKGDVLLLIGSMMFALQIMGIDHYVKDHDPIVLTFVSQITLSVFALIAALLFEKIDGKAMMECFWPVFYTVFISGVLAQFLQTRFQKDLDPSLASLLMSFESVFGALFGWLLLGQTMNMKEIFGCFLVFIAILMAES